MAAPFLDVAELLAVAALAGGLAVLLRQPLVVAFLAAGVVGPSAMDVVPHPGQVRFRGELGIALLMFRVGLRLRTMGLLSDGNCAVR